MIAYQSILIPRKPPALKSPGCMSGCPLFTHVNYFSNAEEALSLLRVTVFIMNLFHLIHIFELTCFRSSHQTLFYEIDTFWYQKRCSDSPKCHKLVNCLMLWERINAKLLVTILLFKPFDKTCYFAVLICWAALVPANQYISTQK